MALKIFTGAKPFLKVYIKPFGIAEMGMLPMQASGILFVLRGHEILIPRDNEAYDRSPIIHFESDFGAHG